MRTLSLIIFTIAPFILHANQLPFTITYEVAVDQPRSAKLGSVSITTGGGNTLIAITNSGINSSVFYSKELCVIQEVENQSILAEIRPSQTTGKSTLLPLLPSEIITLNLVKPEKRSTGTSYSIADPSVVAYDDGIPFEPAEIKHQVLLGAKRMTEIRVLHDKKLSETWSYLDYRIVGGVAVPGRITHHRFKAGGLNISEDDTTEWRLIQADQIPANKIPTAESFLIDDTTVQDNRNPAEPFAFAFQKGRGTLEEQLQLARRLKVSRQGDRNSPASASPFVPILVGIIGTAIGVASYRRHQKRA
ncbi:MAG: hypothetical protein WCK51_05810 [Armatimonadota bacterium]